MAASSSARAMADLHTIAQAMCSIDLAESQWTQELPRLPVPDLWLTVSRYLGSLKSVLAPAGSLEEMLDPERQIGCQLTREQIKANWRQYDQTDQLVKMFMLNEGPELQRDLKEYANKCQNWATDHWLQDMYLTNPIPLPVNSNPFFLFPRQQFQDSTEMLMFATRVIQFSVDFKFRIDQQALRQDYGKGHGKGKALCMETYKNFFHSYRMPHEDMDRLLPQSRRSNHIVVASCNQFYILRLGQEPLDDPYRRDTGSQLNETSIFEQLLRIYRVSREQARRRLADPDSAPRAPRAPLVGLLTTENRKQWARLHRKLSHCGAAQAGRADAAAAPSNGSSSPNRNTESLRQIEDCLFVMCLDSLVRRGSCADGNGNGGSPSADRHQDEEVRAAQIVLSGGGSHLFTANRWFDKFLQIIVGRDGICGINIEHSASEGITVLRFLEEFLGFIKDNPIAVSATSQTQSCGRKFNYATNPDQTQAAAGPALQQPPGQGQTDLSSASSSITSPGYVEPKSPSALLEESDSIKPLMWHLDAELEEALQLAEQRANSLASNLDLVILRFEHFGPRFVKGQSLSPDAFVQLALQLTFYKLHGRLVSTYESASLRQFRLGRVDNIRANTCEAYHWILAMMTAMKGASSESRQQRFKSAEAPFIRAITKQVEILRYTISGGGPDNHLLSLRELAKIRYGKDELPDLFLDKSYREFLNFRLSTSQLPNESDITVGYGAVTPDGYGCSYNPCEDRIVFCISSFLDCPETSSAKFAATLEQSLLEMRELCLGRQATGSGDSK